MPGGRCSNASSTSPTSRPAPYASCAAAAASCGAPTASRKPFRAIVTGDLNPDQVTTLIDRWICNATRSRLPAFVKAATTIRKHRDGIATAIRLRINNGRAEGLNNVVRLIIRRARGFRTPEAALALVMLTCGPITLHLPHEQSP